MSLRFLSRAAILSICILALPLSGSLSARPADKSESWTNDLRPIQASEWNYASAAHLLERAGFSGTPTQIEQLAAMTPRQAVDYLVDYESIDASSLHPFVRSEIYDGSSYGSQMWQFAMADMKELRMHSLANERQQLLLLAETVETTLAGLAMDAGNSSSLVSYPAIAQISGPC